MNNLALLLENGRQRQLPKGQVLSDFEGNFGLARIKSGYIKRYLITKEGNQSIQGIYGPGDIFPLTPVFRHLLKLEIYDGEEIVYYETLAVTRLYSIPLAELKDQVDKNPELHENLLRVAGNRLNSNIHHLENMSLANSYRRLAHQLLYFASQFGEFGPEGITILLPLTNSDLSSVLDLTRETVSRNFSRLRQKGLVKNGTHIMIPDIEKLRREIS
jgi:CRP-like cAMP-binding protein